MTGKPEQSRAQAREYRELHAYFSGPVLSDAIEQVALALAGAANDLKPNCLALPNYRAFYTDEEKRH